MIPANAAAAVVGLGLALAAQPASAQALQFRIPEQAAVTGIPEFARQARVQIVSPIGAEGERTKAVNGHFTVDDALKRLLRGTSLRVVVRTGSFISLGMKPRVAKRPSPPASRPKPLPTAPSDEVNERDAESAPDIIVSGTRFRLSPLPQAEKRTEVALVSSIGSEEMTKRTDTSVAAALNRLPGVVLQRGTQTSQAWYPAIRGFNGWYNSVTLDGGMLYLSTRNQRGVPLDFIPTAVVNEIVVFKTVTPEMDPNSIGGHIDIRTLRSFDNDGLPLTKLDVQAMKYTQPGSLRSADPSYNVNGIIKRTFGSSGNFGFVIGGSTHNDRYSELINTTMAFVQRNDVDIPSGRLTTGNYTSRTHGASLMGKLEGRGDQWYGYIASNYFEEAIDRDLSRSNVSIVPALVTNATPRTGSFTGAIPLALSNIFRNDRQVFSARGAFEYQTNATSKLVANASYLDVRFYEQFWTGGSLSGPAVSGTYVISNSSAATSIFGPPSLADPHQWTQDSTALANQTFYPLRTKIVTARLEYKANNFDFSRGWGYDLGVDYRQMWRRLDQYAYNFTLPAGSTVNLSQVLKDGSTFNGADPSRPIYVDSEKYFNLMQEVANRTIDNAPTSNYVLDEAVIAPFAAVYFTTDKFRVLAGLRYNVTHYTNATSTVTAGAVTPFRITRTLPYLLPNIQGYYNLTESLRLRAAYTETTALQNYSDFAMGITTNFDAKGNPVIQGSNPRLKPRKSYNQDVSLEWYLPKGYVSLGYFHKTIVNEVQSVTQFTFDGNGVLTSTLQSPINAGGEDTQGLELEGQWRNFTGVASWLRGLTVDINGALFKSYTKAIVGAGVQRRVNYLRQQPKWVANLILTYDTGSFSASLLAMSRGRAFNSFAVNPASDIYIEPFSSLDAKIGFRINRYLQVYAEGRNLTNPYYREVYGTNADRVSYSIRSGRTFVFGAKATF